MEFALDDNFVPLEQPIKIFLYINIERDYITLHNFIAFAVYLLCT